MKKGTPEIVKICTDCKTFRPISDFWRLKKSPDGRAQYCKECFGRRNADARDRRLAKTGQERQRTYRPRDALPTGTKRCPDCERVLPVEDFVASRRSADGAGSYCKPCQNARSRESRERLHGSTRHYHLKRRYGVGAAEVLEMLLWQGSRCVICQRELTEETAHVDHDHATGAVRAVLCFNCNGGLGQFRDDAALLRAAASYLEGDVWRPILEAPGDYQLPTSM